MCIYLQNKQNKKMALFNTPIPFLHLVPVEVIHATGVLISWCLSRITLIEQFSVL